METLFGYDAEPSENQQSALGFMSRIYLGKSNSGITSKKMILVKAGLQTEGDVKMGVVYQLQNGFLVHFSQKNTESEESVISFYFEGFSSSSVVEIKEKISKVILQSEKTVFFNSLSPQFSNSFPFLKKLLIPMSFAASADSGLPALCGGSNQITTKSEGGESSMLKNAWNCTKGLGGGVWDSTGGLVTDTAHMLWAGAKGAGKAIIHPVETYDAASAEMKKYKAMFSDLEKSFGTLKEAYNQLPDEVKWKMGCEITGQLGTTGVITYLTVGGGSPAFLRTISKSLYRVAEQLPAGSAAAEKAMNLSRKMAEKAEAHAAQMKPQLKANTQKDIVVLEEKLKSLIEKRKALELEQQIRKQKLAEELSLAERKYKAIQSPDPALMKAPSLSKPGKIYSSLHEKIEAVRGESIFGLNHYQREKITSNIGRKIFRDQPIDQMSELDAALAHISDGGRENIALFERDKKDLVQRRKDLKELENYGTINGKGISELVKRAEWSDAQLDKRKPITEKALAGEIEAISQVKSVVSESLRDQIENAQTGISYYGQLAKWHQNNSEETVEKVLQKYAKELGVSKDQLLFSHFERRYNPVTGTYFPGSYAASFEATLDKAIADKALRENESFAKELQLFEKEKADAVAVTKHKEKLANEIQELKSQLSKPDKMFDTVAEKTLQKDIEALQKKLQIQSQDVNLSAKEKSALAVYTGVTACRAIGTAVSPAVSKDQSGVK